MAQKYDAGSIKVLEGLDAVRMRPGMYIGSTGSRGLHHLLWEIVDNAIDEAMGGYANEVSVTLHKDGSASVWDNGRGMPVDNHPELGVPGVQVIFTKLHAGGKFGNDNYAYSGGLHGVGASVVNALSKWLTVDIFRDWSHYTQRYESYFDSKQKKIMAGHPVTALEKVGNTRKRGSLIRFLPDDTIFEETVFNDDTVRRRLRELAYLNKGLKITFVDERTKEEGKAEAEYCFAGGIVDYVKFLNRDKTPLQEEPIFFEGKRDGVICAAAIQYTDGYTESVFSYVNNIPTGEGGTHETGFRAALTKALNDYARKIGALKEKDNNLAGEDFREGITVVLTTMVKNPQFEGQTKGRLGNTEVRPAVEAIVTEKLYEYLENLKNQDMAQKIIEKAMKSARVREATRKARNLARAKNELEAAPLVGKLSACTGRKAVDNELFIVEGDSAGGSAKQGRDRRFQAILPLRGKPLNAEKKRLDQVLANDEFRSIITALGTGIAEDFDLSSLKYHKVIILADADQDGAHIRSILLTFFFRYMRDLVADGHVYIGMPPLYAVKKNNGIQYAYDDRELKKVTTGIKGYTLQRYKGLGEMNPEQLWETTMDPAHRKLMQVTVEDAAEADSLITILMGDKVEPRREYIIEHAEFNKADHFDEKLKTTAAQTVGGNDMPNKQYRPFRITVDLWVARVGSIVAWVWLVFWALMGVTGLGMFISGQAEDTTEKILPFFCLGLAALHWLAVKACRRTKELELNFHLYCAIFAREPNKSIEEVAKAVKEPVSAVMADLKEMCRRGYFNGYIDYGTERMVFPHYRPPESTEKPDLNVIQCPGCGAVNAIAKTGDACKYCGAPLVLFQKDAE